MGRWGGWGAGCAQGKPSPARGCRTSLEVFVLLSSASVGFENAASGCQESRDDPAWFPDLLWVSEFQTQLAQFSKSKHSPSLTQPMLAGASWSQRTVMGQERGADGTGGTAGGVRGCHPGTPSFPCPACREPTQPRSRCLHLPGPPFSQEPAQEQEQSKAQGLDRGFSCSAPVCSAPLGTAAVCAYKPLPVLINAVGKTRLSALTCFLSPSVCTHTHCFSRRARLVLATFCKLMRADEQLCCALSRVCSCRELRVQP